MRVHQPFGASNLLVDRLRLVLGLSEDLSKSAAPQYVASFGVRLDLHVVTPCVGFVALLGQSVSPSPGRFGKLVELAAPQCVASFGVRLYLHGSAPCLGFLLLAQFGYAPARGVSGNPEINCPTVRCQLWCSSLPSWECSLPGIFSTRSCRWPSVLDGSETRQFSCPTVRCRPSYLSLPSWECPFPGRFA